MSGDRSGEIIPAGIAPSKVSSTQNTFERVHRGTGFILAIDVLIIVIVFSSFIINRLIGSATPELAQVIIIVPAIAGGLIWTGYRRQKEWSYWPAAVIILLAALCFGLQGLIYLWLFIYGEPMSSLLMALLLGWATFGSIRRVRFHFHPGYKAAFFGEGEGNSMDIELEEGEMFAACSSCLAVLAIRPNMLSVDDRCPHCNNKLVSKHTAAKYEEE